MIRNLPFAVVFLLIFAAHEIVQAQTLVSPALQDPKPEPPPNVLRVYPMDQPDPLLRYRLWPAPKNNSQKIPLHWSVGP